MADGEHLPGYVVRGTFILAEASCQCWLAVRFGTRNGERRAYLTADYGHDNPGTVVDLEIAGGALVVRRTDVFVPGTHTLSGVVTEQTQSGRWVLPTPSSTASTRRGQDGRKAGPMPMGLTRFTVWPTVAERSRSSRRATRP